jgi:CheY-like chemotaxis protein
MKTKKQILIVEDEVSILHVLALKLRQGGFEVLTAPDGAAGLELAQVERPDLVISDYQMPHLSGLEMCQRLRQNRRTRDIPAILLTARGFDLDEPALVSAGIVHCMSKPFSPQEVLVAVQDLLENLMV